jgi:hypothetical protein
MIRLAKASSATYTEPLCFSKKIKEKMSKKQKVSNKRFNSVKNKLEFIQKNCPETELFEDLRVLFKNKGFNNVKITHGVKEYGKDLVFSKYDDTFEEEVWYGVIVKNKPARQNDFLPNGEIGIQVQLALKKKFTTSKGEEKSISRLFIVINGNVTDNAIELIKVFVEPVVLPNIKLYDYQDLREQIEKFSKDSFLDNLEPNINLFISEQIKSLSNIGNANGIYDLKTDDIDSIFVSVQTTYSRELRKIDEYVTFDDDEKTKSDGNVDVEGSKEVIYSKSNFIVHGIPTSGKTIFLKRIGLNALRLSNGKLIAAFYFDLQKHSQGVFDIQNEISNQHKILTKGDDFDSLLYEKTILLFDSIDFVASDEQRKKILESICKFNEEDSENNYQIVIAARKLASINKFNCFEHFKETELLPFNFGQALQLVKKIIPNDAKKSSNFISALKNSMLNTSLQRTPLALTLLAVLYRDDHVDLKELPANIFALYDLFTNVYLDQWDSKRGITTLYKYEQTKNILAFIAFHLHSLGQHQIAKSELKIFLEKLRGSYNYDELKDISSFLQHLKEQNGIFIYEENLGAFTFFNHYFQEYFASICIEDEAQHILIDNFFNDWWNNSVIFYCGKNPKSNQLHKDIISKIVPLDAQQKLSYINQHSKCLQASHSISITNRQAVIEKLLVEYDKFFITLAKESSANPESFYNSIPFVSLISQSRTLFDSVFDSKHVSTEETISFFENILLSDDDFSDITFYNIAYFLAYKQNNAVPFELFSDKVIGNHVWSRIIYVDINFLKLKKKINQKKYIRIRRKMRQNKYTIQSVLKGNVVNYIEEKPKA